MKRKKLLYVGNALSARGKTLTHIESLSKDLRLEGYDVIVTSDKNSKGYRLVDMIKTFFKSKKKVDLVIIDTYSTVNFWYAVIIATLSRIYNKSYIPILHGGNLPSRLEKNPRTSRKLFGKAFINIAPSGYLYDAFAKANFSNLKCIPNSIDLSQYSFKERNAFAPKLLWVRSFASIYNPLMAIEVLKLLGDTFPESTLTMVGPDKDGSLKHCKKYAQNHNLSVTFTGKLSKSEWIKLSEESDVFINTTNFDNTPLSVVEAMALGLPVVSTDVGGMPFLISDKEDGVLSPAQNKNAFVQCVIDLLNHPQETREMTVNARTKVLSFDWALIKDQWHEVLS